MPRLIISAPQGHSGKTTVAIGLSAAFVDRGLTVQTFKKGPDYIDPSWLAAASGRPCFNLDPIIMTEQGLFASFRKACRGADLALVEGAMGLYDGIDTPRSSSTAELARLLQCPVVLVVNSSRMTDSVAAMVNGYIKYRSGITITGVILNNVAGSRHEHKLRTAVEKYCGIPVVGSIPRDPKLEIKERHLGLVPYGEMEKNSNVDYIGACFKNNVNLDAILNIAGNAAEFHGNEIDLPAVKGPIVKLGVLYDHIFSFYYQDNLEALTGAGAELVFINSVKDNKLPEIDGLYIGGGFPELFARELEGNYRLRCDIAQAIENGLPVYAECAGLLYLCKSIKSASDTYEMVGVFPAEVEMCDRPKGHGYVEVEVCDGNYLFPSGYRFWGHEFHNSVVTELGSLKFSYKMHRGRGIDGGRDGILYKNVLAAYTHLHASGVPQWAETFVSVALKERSIRNALLLQRS